MSDMKPTPGPWIVKVKQASLFEVASVRVVNAVTGKIVAVCDTPAMAVSEAIANAALISISNDMLDAIVAVQATVINAMDGDIQATVEAAPIAAMISDVLEKLVNEAGIK